MEKITVHVNASNVKKSLRKRSFSLAQITGVKNMDSLVNQNQANSPPTPDIFYKKDSTAGLVAQAEQLIIDDE